MTPSLPRRLASAGAIVFPAHAGGDLVALVVEPAEGRVAALSPRQPRLEAHAPGVCWRGGRLAQMLAPADRAILARLWPDVCTAGALTHLGLRHSRYQDPDDGPQPTPTDWLPRGELPAELDDDGLPVLPDEAAALAVGEALLAAARRLADDPRLAEALWHWYAVEEPFAREFLAAVEPLRVDASAWLAFQTRAKTALERTRRYLREQGVVGPSRRHLIEFIHTHGFEHAFAGSGADLDVDNRALERAERLHPVFPGFRRYWRYRWLLESLERDIDGQWLRPEWVAVGAVTARCTSRSPNVLGLPRRCRPLIAAREGCGIGECDYAQFELGIAAATFDDAALLRAYHTGDLYSSVALELFEGVEQPTAEQVAALRERRPELRDRAKILCLGVLYGMTAHSVALRFGVNEAEADQWVDRFFRRYPALRAGLDALENEGLRQGYAQNNTGLRRRRLEPDSAPSWWERNWFRNYPIQASAAAVFKLAVARCAAVYGPSTRVLIPHYDAIVFEAPLHRVEDVATLTAEVMRATLADFYPALRPRVDINASAPWCWNKGGEADSLERFEVELWAGE